MSWLFSQALVAEFSEATCWDGAPSAPLSVMPTQHRFWRNDRQMDACQLSRFGLTCAVLTADHGEALLTWFREVSLARTSVQPVLARALLENDPACGVRWPELSVKFSLTTSSWRTHLCLWEEDLPWSSVTLPRWGMTRSGHVYQHPTSERPINATASGLWRTPTSQVTGPKKSVIKLTGRSPGDPQVGLADQVAAAERNAWPTPTVHGNYNRPGASKKAGWGLASAARLWTTPAASDATRGGRITSAMTGTSLAQQINTPGRWPTPVASMAKGSSPASLTRKSGTDRRNDRLDHAVMASDGGQLNPTWVEWLMGWPLGWTDLKPLEMDRFREWQQQHSPCCDSVIKDAAA